MCNPNIENNILNWIHSEIKRYKKLKCRGGGPAGGGSQLGLGVGVENPKT